LRNLQILAEIAAEKNSTIVFPAQFLESARALSRFVEQESRSAQAAPTPPPVPAVTTVPADDRRPSPDWPVPQDEALTDPLKDISRAQQVKPRRPDPLRRR
ncbi:hypothetical protein ACWC9T_38135, partial [Kitasatospora sp. NPDC001159]